MEEQAPGPPSAPAPAAPKPNKVFVGGLSWETT